MLFDTTDYTVVHRYVILLIDFLNLNLARKLKFSDTFGEVTSS